MVNAITIPALPCASISEMLDFYVALGFTVTYQQERPNAYACVQYEDIELHFFSMKGYEPANSYSTCLVIVPDLGTLHQVFKSGLKTSLGKVHVAGIPRLTRPNNNNSAGDWRFNVVDPGGNWIRFIQRDSHNLEKDTSKQNKTKLGRALHAATLLIDAKGDFAGAAQMLDKALNQEEDYPAAERVQALVLRAESAINLGEHTLARSLLEKMNGISIDETEQAALAETLQRADDLRDML